MAKYAERVCALCEKPVDLPMQLATIGDALCEACLRARARAYDEQLTADVVAKLEAPEYDLHAPGI